MKVTIPTIPHSQGVAFCAPLHSEIHFKNTCKHHLQDSVLDTPNCALETCSSIALRVKFLICTPRTTHCCLKTYEIYREPNAMKNYLPLTKTKHGLMDN